MGDRIPHEGSSLFPEGPLGKERNDCNVAIGDQFRKFFSNKRADRETIMRNKFRMCSQLKHHLWNKLSETLGASCRIAKSDRVRVLIAHIKAPCLRHSEDFMAPCPESGQEFAADIPSAHNHHLVEDACLPRLGDIFLPGVLL